MLAIIFKPITTVHLGSITIFTWGLFVSLGIIIALIMARILIKDDKLKFDYVLNITLISIILGFIGSRLLFIFLESDKFDNPIAIFRIWDGGLALYGGLVLAIFGGVIYVKKHKLDVLRVADLLTPIIVIAIGIARVGCLLVNDHLGKLTELPWGITVDRVTRHPLSAYYALSLLILFVLLVVFRKSFLRTKGFSTFFALTWYGLFRFIIDNFKDFEGRVAVFYANQIFLLLVFIISFYFLIKIIKSPNLSSS